MPAAKHVSVRRYVASDAASTWQVFHDAVHGTASRDYTRQQLDAWAPAEVDLHLWHERRAKAYTYVACTPTGVVGFSDYTEDGVLDMLFVHPRVGGQGVARLLVEKVLSEAAAAGHQQLQVHVSQTALPAFLRFGFTLGSSGYPEVRGQVLQNFNMSKTLRPER